MAPLPVELIWRSDEILPFHPNELKSLTAQTLVKKTRILSVCGCGAPANTQNSATFLPWLRSYQKSFHGVAEWRKKFLSVVVSTCCTAATLSFLNRQPNTAICMWLWDRIKHYLILRGVYR